MLIVRFTLGTIEEYATSEDRQYRSIPAIRRFNGLLNKLSTM